MLSCATVRHTGMRSYSHAGLEASGNYIVRDVVTVMSLSPCLLWLRPTKIQIQTIYLGFVTRYAYYSGGYYTWYGVGHHPVGPRKM